MSVVLPLEQHLKKRKKSWCKGETQSPEFPLPLGVGVFWKFLLDSDVRF